MYQYQSAQAQYASAADAYQQAVLDQAKKLFLEQFRDIRTGRYGIKVDDSPNSPTAKMAAFAELMEIARMIPGEIPSAMLVESSDLPNKNKIIQSMQSRAGQPALNPAGMPAPIPAGNAGLPIPTGHVGLPGTPPGTLGAGAMQ
jgi:hypothetical protein